MMQMISRYCNPLHSHKNADSDFDFWPKMPMIMRYSKCTRKSYCFPQNLEIVSLFALETTWWFLVQSADDIVIFEHAIGNQIILCRIWRSYHYLNWKPNHDFWPKMLMTKWYSKTQIIIRFAMQIIIYIFSRFYRK